MSANAKPCWKTDHLQKLKPVESNSSITFIMTMLTCLDIVETILFALLRAIREGNWQLHLSAIQALMFRIWQGTCNLPVYYGMRRWQTFKLDTLACFKLSWMGTFDPVVKQHLDTSQLTRLQSSLWAKTQRHQVVPRGSAWNQLQRTGTTLHKNTRVHSLVKWRKWWMRITQTSDLWIYWKQGYNKTMKL